jgi:metallophosphoesterase (TIGR00282 family)
MIKGLIVGDLIGKHSVNLFSLKLSAFKEKYNVDFVIVNGENAANGKGITSEMANTLKNAGVNMITSGNHIWQAKTRNVLNSHLGFVLRPINYPTANEGKGYGIFSIGETKIAVINAIGRTYIADQTDNPFVKTMEAFENLKTKADLFIVDFHAEASAEKIALARYLDGKASAVVGTHTHVQTADEKILPGGTAYITDLGMTGPTESVIGMKIEPALKRFLRGTPTKYELAEGDIDLNAVLIEFNEKSGKAASIKRINHKLS